MVGLKYIIITKMSRSFIKKIIRTLDHTLNINTYNLPNGKKSLQTELTSNS